MKRSFMLTFYLSHDTGIRLGLLPAIRVHHPLLVVEVSKKTNAI
jgi:hypothetical protein